MTKIDLDCDTDSDSDSEAAALPEHADEKKRLQNFQDQVSIIQVNPFDSLRMRFGRGVVDGG